MRAEVGTMIPRHADGRPAHRREIEAAAVIPDGA